MVLGPYNLGEELLVGGERLLYRLALKDTKRLALIASDLAMKKA